LVEEREQEKDEYISGYYDFQKYLIDPEYRQTFSYLTKEFGIANLNPFEIFIIRFEMEIVDFCYILGAKDGANSFLADIYATLSLSRSKGGFGAKLLVSQITKGSYEMNEKAGQTRFFNFGKKNRDEDNFNYQNGGM